MCCCALIAACSCGFYMGAMCLHQAGLRWAVLVVVYPWRYWWLCIPGLRHALQHDKALQTCLQVRLVPDPFLSTHPIHGSWIVIHTFGQSSAAVMTLVIQVMSLFCCIG